MWFPARLFCVTKVLYLNMEKLKVEFTDELLTEAVLKVKMTKTVWWYICLVLGLTGFTSMAIRLSETKTLIKIINMSDETING